MTIEIKDEFTIKSKRKEHPNARKYPGRASMEVGNALLKFLGELDQSEKERLTKGTLIVEPEATAELFDSVMVGDVVGLALIKSIEKPNKGPTAYLLKVLSIDRDGDTMHVRNVTWEDEKNRPEYKGDECHVAFEDFSVALGLGFGEILERDGKPFGVSEEIEYTVKVIGPPSGSAGKKSATPKKKRKRRQR